MVCIIPRNNESDLEECSEWQKSVNLRSSNSENWEGFLGPFVHQRFGFERGIGRDLSD